jgi:hypothetical protein
MQEIEISSYSRNASRLSIRTIEGNNEDFISPEVSLMLDLNYDTTIESLLQIVDRQQMTIEDFRSEEQRRSPENAFEDLDRIRKEVWLELKSQQRDKLEREKNLLEEKIRQADQSKEKYLQKTNELSSLLQKLKHREDQLNHRENEIRAQRLAVDKLKMDQDLSKQVKPSQLPPNKGNHARSHSFSFYAAGRNEAESSSLHDTLKNLNLQLKNLENDLALDQGLGRSEKEMKVENLKNKIARIRSEIAISEANRGTCLINNMMESLKKEVDREEKMKRVELIQAAKNLQVNKLKPPLVPFKTPDGKNSRREMGESNCFDDFESNLEVLKENNTGGRKREKNGIERQGVEWEKEEFLNSAWVKLPAARELVENVNLTLAKLNGDKRIAFRGKEDGIENKTRMMRKN